MGATLFVFAIFFLAIWLLSPGSTVAEKFKRAFSSGASTAVSLFSVFVFLSILTGLGQAWAKDESTAVFGVFALPHFLDWSWETSGYLHSSFSSISIALFSGMVFVYLFTCLTKYCCCLANYFTFIGKFTQAALGASYRCIWYLCVNASLLLCGACDLLLGE
jgi:cytochrome b561